MDRYTKPMEVKKTPTGKLVYKPNILSSPSYNPYVDSVITASDTIRMDVLANNMYGSANDWWRIASVNRRVDGSLYFKAGTQVIIPNK